MAAKMVGDCGESRRRRASWRHERRQEIHRCRRRQARRRAKPVRRRRSPRRSKKIRRPARARADALRRLAVQRQGDRLLGTLANEDRQGHLPSRLQGRAVVVGSLAPDNALSQDPPAKTDVAIVGAGYGGLATALELRRNGIGAVVLERGDFGIGASTRNGGMISGGTNLGKGLGGKSPIAEEFERKKAELMGAGADSLSVLEDIIAREKIECGLHKNGRFVGAWTPRHYDDLASQGRHLQQVRRCRQRDGAARAPARVHRLRLLLWRHVCPPRRPSASGALLQGPARGGPSRRRHAVRQCRSRAHREDARRLARAHLQGTGRRRARW